MKYIRDLREIAKDGIDLVGGKAASLGEMMQLGISVPPGFVVIVTAFEEFSDAGISKELADEIQASFKQLGATKVAVRSSATAEDSKTAAWAGQLETYLNTTKESLIKNIEKCWASLASPRALTYRSERGLSTKKISVAIVVQEMIQSDSAGVAFSVHPVTQDNNQLIIEAGSGLGEAVVSGEITPDSYIVEKDSRRISRKTVQNSQAVLSDNQVLELTDVVLKIEKHYGFPVDVEWAYEKDRLFILQSRPITTLNRLGKNLTNKATKREKSIDPEALLSDMAPIEYWAEELTPPLYGVTDSLQPGFKDNFLCIFKAETNTCTFYFIKNRYQQEVEAGYAYFERKDSVREYTELVERAIQESELLSGRELSFNELLNISRRWDEIYNLTEAVRLKKFEQADDQKAWARFKDLAKIRLRFRGVFKSLHVQSDKIMAEIVKTHHIPRDDLFFYTYDEFQRLLAQGKKVIARTILDRKKGYAFWIKDKEKLLITGTQSKKLGDRLYQMMRGENPKEIKGQSVLEAPIVRGRVQLILHNKKDITSQLKKFKEGMILVTEMTRPESVVICHKARAIITDEGGVISHAAIISRELKIPCIVGTKVATKVLKDGDLVEVDTNNGIVRVLKDFKDKLI